MTSVLWIFAGLAACGFAYTMRFTQATLSYGRELAGTNSGTGYQDAVTPPWQTNLAMITYISDVAAIGLMWSYVGWGSGLGVLALIVFGGAIVGAVLPKQDAAHFRNLMQMSMVSRYANFVRDGDAMRAEAMQQLLTKSGVGLNEHSSE